MTTPAIQWRGHALAYQGDDSWSNEVVELSDESACIYIGVSCDDAATSSWSATLECGQLTGEGDGASAELALEAAREDFWSNVALGVERARQHFGQAS